MKNNRNWGVILVEAVIALPLVYLLWLLAVELIDSYGLVVVPVGGVIYFLISLLVDKFLCRQSEQLEQALQRKLPFTAGKPANRREEKTGLERI